MTRAKVPGFRLVVIGVVAALGSSVVTVLVVWTVTTYDAPPLPVSEASAPAPDNDLASAATATAAADVDIDPSRSRDEQIAVIRRQLALLGATPAATLAPATPDRAAAAPRRVADAAPGATPSAIPLAEPEPDTGPAPTELIAEPATRPAGVSDAAPSVAVLPFVNLSRNPADDWISTDMTAALRTALEQTGTMEVVALTAADESTALETAGGRGARWLIGGAYQRVGDRLRITARVLLVADGDLIRSVKVDGNIKELDTLTTEMVATVREEVDGRGNAPRTTAARDPLRRPDAGVGGLASPAADEPAAVVVGAAPGGTVTTLVVLPFDDLSPSEEGVPTVALGAAITNAVAARLAELAEVTVVSSRDGASWIVDGVVQRIGGVVRVTARLVDVESGSVLKAVKVDGTIDAIAELQARVASALSERVRDAFSARDAADGRGATADVGHRREAALKGMTGEGGMGEVYQPTSDGPDDTSPVCAP